jgi:hypothetical protein
METCKYDLKLFFHEAASVELEAFIPVFHRWIQVQCLDEVLIDVADYRHVHHGPGVVLVAHDAHYAIDMAEGQPGLLYSRRRETHPSRRHLQSEVERLFSVLHCALSACQRLEAESVFQGRVRFRGDTFMLRSNDRLLAPNTPQAKADLLSSLTPVLNTLYSEGDVELHTQVASRLTVMVRSTANADVETLRSRLGGHVQSQVG